MTELHTLDPVTLLDLGHVNIPTRWHKSGVFKCTHSLPYTDSYSERSTHSQRHPKGEDLKSIKAPLRTTTTSTTTNRQQKQQEDTIYYHNFNTIMASRRSSTGSTSSMSHVSTSVINAFEEESVRNHRQLQDADDKAQIKLYKKVYGTMLKNNLVSHEKDLNIKQTTEKKHIDAYNAEIDCNSNNLKEIKSTKVQNSTSSNQPHHSKTRIEKTFERLKNHQEVVTTNYPNIQTNSKIILKRSQTAPGSYQNVPENSRKIAKYIHNISQNTQSETQSSQNVSNKHQNIPPQNPKQFEKRDSVNNNNNNNNNNINNQGNSFNQHTRKQPTHHRFKSDVKRTDSSTNQGQQQQHRSRQTTTNLPKKRISPPRIPIPERLRIQRPELQIHMISKPQPLTTFGTPSTTHLSHPNNNINNKASTIRRELESRLSTTTTSLHQENDNYPQDNNSSTSRHGDRVYPKLGSPSPRRATTTQSFEQPPPDPPIGRAKNHLIFMCVLLCIITVAVVCVVSFLAQGQGQDNNPKKPQVPKYNVLKINVTFHPVNQTSGVMDGQTNGLSLQQMERMMSTQVDEMFLRSNLSTKYCCNTITASRTLSTSVVSTITLSDDDQDTNPRDVTAALGSLFVLTGNHGDGGPDLQELSPCYSCAAMEYGVTTERPRILLYNLKVT